MMWNESDVAGVLSAAASFDRPHAELFSDRLAFAARSGPDPEPLPAARRVLEALRDVRYYDLLQRVGDALIQGGQHASSIQRLYAQALIDLGATAAAAVFLERLAGEASEDLEERAEVRGLLGRAFKQAYVSGDARSLARRELLRRSVSEYLHVYRGDRTKTWQGINAVAMMARARRDGIADASWPDELAIARDVLKEVDRLVASRSAQPWDYATCGEAHVALRQWDGAARAYDRYVASPDIPSFAIAGSLRQLEEVWQLDARGGEGAPLVLLLRANLLSKEGGTVAAPDTGGELARLQSVDKHLQAILGHDRYQPLDWYRRGLERSLAVARIGIDRSQGIGTGFLIDGGELCAAWKGDPVLVTNSHVLSDAIRGAVRPGEAVVTFEALDGGAREYSVAQILWSSVPGDLDCTIARLNEDVPGVPPMKVANGLPPETDPHRVYVIGHPRGGTLSFSMQDNLLLGCSDPLVHYRAPTEPGSSGSPVFNRQWNLLALHHAGGPNVRGLRPPHDPYPANEGIYIGSIRKALQTCG